MQENREQGTETFVIEGRNAVLEAFRSGRTIDKIYILDGCPWKQAGSPSP